MHFNFIIIELICLNWENRLFNKNQNAVVKSNLDKKQMTHLNVKVFYFEHEKKKKMIESFVGPKNIHY